MQSDEQQSIFEAWLKQHKGILFKIMRAYAFTPHDQDDLFQEMCVRVWKSIPDFRGESKPSTWMYRVALYAALSWSRREYKHRGKTEPLDSVVRPLIATDAQPDSRLDWLYAQIGQLEAVDRSVCLLMLDGFAYAEIADLLGISANYVGVKVHRIKQQLATAAKKEVEDLS